MEKKGHFSNILTFMEKKVNFVLIKIAMLKLLNSQYPVVQLFAAQNVKNNKVDPINLPIYTIYKICRIQNQQLDV